MLEFIQQFNIGIQQFNLCFAYHQLVIDFINIGFDIFFCYLHIFFLETRSVCSLACKPTNTCPSKRSWSRVDTSSRSPFYTKSDFFKCARCALQKTLPEQGLQEVYSYKSSIPLPLNLRICRTGNFPVCLFLDFYIKQSILYLHIILPCIIHMPAERKTACALDQCILLRKPANGNNARPAIQSHFLSSCFHHDKIFFAVVSIFLNQF